MLIDLLPNKKAIWEKKGKTLIYSESYLLLLHIDVQLPSCYFTFIVCPTKRSSKRKQNMIAAAVTIGCRLVIFECHYLASSLLPCLIGQITYPV